MSPSTASVTPTGHQNLGLHSHLWDAAEENVLEREENKYTQRCFHPFSVFNKAGKLLVLMFRTIPAGLLK